MKDEQAYRNSLTASSILVATSTTSFTKQSKDSSFNFPWNRNIFWSWNETDKRTKGLNLLTWYIFSPNLFTAIKALVLKVTANQFLSKLCKQDFIEEMFRIRIPLKRYNSTSCRMWWWERGWGYLPLEDGSRGRMGGQVYCLPDVPAFH